VNDKHLIFRLRQGDRHRRAVFFDSASGELPPAPWDIAFRICPDNYEGETLIGIQIEAVREAERLQPTEKIKVRCGEAPLTRSPRRPLPG